MKNFLLVVSILFFLCFNLAEAQPSLPDSSNVLVVFNSLSQISGAVKDYYINARHIPEDNIVHLDQLTNAAITDPVSGTTHSIELRQGNEGEEELIFDVNNYNTQEASIHAWIYFNERIAKPIAQHLNTTIVNSDTLKNIIRFIVLCKGIPFRIEARPSHNEWLGLGQNTPIDGILCLVGETINNPDALLAYYGHSVANPYYNADPNFSIKKFFVPNQYSDNNVTISYLVTHLDGVSYEVITDMIERSKAAINPGDYDWLIDADPTPCSGEGEMVNQIFDTQTNFILLGISNYFFDTDDYTTLTTHPKPIMSYSSNGSHTTVGPNNPTCNYFFQSAEWIQNELDFTFAPGAVFNTAESYNANTIGTWPIQRRPGASMGQVPEFTFIGGTAGFGHAYEPGTANIVENSIMFPSYALGYTFIEATYLAMHNLTGENVVVGDPLTRIAYPCEPTIISNNTIIGTGEYDCDIIVDENATLTIDESAILNFNRNAQLIVHGTLDIRTDAELYFNGYSNLTIESNGTIIIGSGSHFVFNDHSKYIMDNDFEITTDDNIVFNDVSEFQLNGILNMGVSSSLTFYNKAQLTVNGPFNISAGATINFYNTSKMRIYGSLTSLGESSNKITFNLSSTAETQVIVTDGLRLEIDNTIINNNGIGYSINSNELEPEYLSITNTTFNNPKWAAINLSLAGKSFQTIPFISNCTFTNCETGAMFLNQIEAINVENNSISLGSSASGIHLTNNGNVNISNCIITGGSKGIATPVPIPEEDIIENLYCELNINQCVFNLQTTAIEVNGQSVLFSSISINANHFEDCGTGILINAFSNPVYDFVPLISNNVMSGNPHGGSEIGISLSNGDEVFVRNNSITNFRTGISLNIVTTPYILENNISTIGLLVEPLSGIISISSNGEIRNNTIQHHWHGIELGSSSPNIGANTITDNLRYGIYINDHSHPDLSEQIIGGDPYPLSGYNTIRENGECNLFPSYSELYLRFNSTVNLEKGCNTIADDREDPALHCNYLYLIDGHHVVGKVNAFRNYWGEVNGGNPVGRFGTSLRVNYGGWLTGPCTYTEVGSALFLVNSKGEVYDTVYASGEAPSELTDIESRYAAANEYYYNNQYPETKQEYESIIEDYGDSTESLQAYNRFYTLANLMNSSPETFNQLKEFYLQKAGNQTDSIMVGTLTHLSDLCLVSATEYLAAINNFDEEAQQNPNTDVALYRQLDALTTALLVSPDSTLNKGILGKYSVNSLSDYTNKLSELLKTRGRGGIESEKELLPTRYYLYQNYPNPFNPVTTIKYDLPNASEVSLFIYDILGRKVKELVNTKQQAGRYEVQFNASNLASGVYIYQLIADKFITSKKMILLK
jgi:uncharacterized protein (TIGR03790 family)